MKEIVISSYGMEINDLLNEDYWKDSWIMCIRFEVERAFSIWYTYSYHIDFFLLRKEIHGNKEKR